MQMNGCQQPAPLKTSSPVLNGSAEKPAQTSLVVLACLPVRPDENFFKTRLGFLAEKVWRPTMIN